MGWNSRSLDGVKHSIKTLNNARQADAYSAGSTLPPTIHCNNTLCAQYGTHWDFDTITDLGSTPVIRAVYRHPGRGQQAYCA
ncbi:hypothetical protein E2N95_03275 [Xylella fastidiosa subsp. multiplex]|nr:hypothetical protein E2N95_03275 [Xylella fastidiosa subsp. multiplex]TVS44660.1 hypothetical protein E2E25_02355 [Xylella fastidiosa subsp. multiplex]TVS46138.1 hypothetical protein E2N96_03275 [Xylella fastidiosa subsp. multiplex]